MEKRRIMEMDKEAGVCLEPFQAISTGWGPEIESALFMDLLKQSLTDPDATDNGDAVVNAYKHRLHSLRCEYADARQRAAEADEQLAEARMHILRLEARVKHLDTTLHQIHASRWWKVKEWCARPWRMVSRWLGRVRSHEQPFPTPDKVRG